MIEALLKSCHYQIDRIREQLATANALVAERDAEIARLVGIATDLTRHNTAIREERDRLRERVAELDKFGEASLAELNRRTTQLPDLLDRAKAEGAAEALEAFRSRLQTVREAGRDSNGIWMLDRAEDALDHEIGLLKQEEAAKLREGTNNVGT